MKFNLDACEVFSFDIKDEQTFFNSSMSRKFSFLFSMLYRMLIMKYIVHSETDNKSFEEQKQLEIKKKHNYLQKTKKTNLY